MFLYESNKRLAIIRRIRNAFIRLPLFSFLRMQSDATFRCQNAIEGKKNLQNRRNGNFLIHTNSPRTSLCTHVQIRSIFRYVKLVKNAWNQESKVKPENVLQKTTNQSESDVTIGQLY